MMTKQDPHHCYCFKILNTHFELLKSKLKSVGFNDTSLQFQNGQLFGLIKKISKDKQIHIKLMPSGQIEAEIEPSHEFPFAHVNPEHSYSAHTQLQNLLNQLGIPYIRNWSIPLSCIRPIIVEPFKPTPVKIMVGMVLVVAFVAVLAYAIVKTSKT